MNCSELESWIDDYVEGSLAGGPLRDIEMHLSKCPGCREAVASLRALLTDAAELPRSVEPPRDLFPAIRSALHPAAGRDGAARHGRATVWLALAASLLVTITAGIVGLVSRDTGSGPDLPVTGPAGVELPASRGPLADFRAAEREYRQATRLLLDAIEAHRDELPAETTAVLDENLQLLDQAIEQVRDTLEAEPQNARNGQLLTALHRQKLQLLRRASRLAS
jgi:hypothetical protein